MDLVEQYRRDGWVRLPERVPDERTGAVVAALEATWRGSHDEKWTNAWRSHPEVARLAADPMVLGVLEQLYGRRPIPFQTLDLRTGSQQRLHADTIHFDSLPGGWMCGVWVALEDVGADQGPLELVRASHELAELRPEVVVGDPDAFDYGAYEDRVARVVAASGDPVERVEARRGDVIVWHADLVHGGAPVLRPGATRWSQVTHVVFEGATYLTPMRSDFARGEYLVRDPLVDISTGRRVVHHHHGEPAVMEHLRNGRTRLLGPGERLHGAARLRSWGLGRARTTRATVAARRDARQR